MGYREYRASGYRWVVLGVFSLLNLVIQLNWIAFAPITVECISLYNTTAFWILFLSMSFMAVYLVVSVPASILIERLGIRAGVGIGAVLMGLFGYLRGVFAQDLTMTILMQCGLAVAQPFILNAITKVAAEWFPVDERATAAGIPTLAQFIGIVLAMAVTAPLAVGFMSESVTKLTLEAVRSALKVYGWISVASSLLFLLLARNGPTRSASSKPAGETIGAFDGIRFLFTRRDMVLLLVLFFLGLGIFNTITTFIDLILAQKGYLVGGNEAGNVGAGMLIAGIIGAIVLPIISDKVKKRRGILVVCLAGLIPGLVGLTFFREFMLLMISSTVFGFFLMGAAPVGFQYAAEVSRPAPESTSQGMILLSGQVSGILFIVLMALFGNVTVQALADARSATDSITLTPFMIVFIVLAVMNLVLGILLRESPVIVLNDKE
jgi:MFS family permease